MSKLINITLGSDEISAAYIGTNKVYSSAVDIAKLFEGGVEGLWYDLSDMSTLFQNSAGTIPVTGHNQPVGLIIDKSGNGLNASQSSSGKRPIYKTDGVGARLYFDGVDDYLTTPSRIHFWSTAPAISIFSKFRPDVAQTTASRYNKKLSILSVYSPSTYYTNLAVLSGENTNNSVETTVTATNATGGLSYATLQAVKIDGISNTAPTQATVLISKANELYRIESVSTASTKDTQLSMTPDNWSKSTSGAYYLAFGSAVFVNHKGDIHSLLVVCDAIDENKAAKIENTLYPQGINP